MEMFSFTVHENKWCIEEVDKDCKEINCDFDGMETHGRTMYAIKKVYIRNDLTRTDKKRVLLHELCHVFISETQCIVSGDDSTKFYSEENLCDFVGMYLCEINKIFCDYFENV
jgi:hypothetical protein